MCLIFFFWVNTLNVSVLAKSQSNFLAQRIQVDGTVVLKQYGNFLSDMLLP